MKHRNYKIIRISIIVMLATGVVLPLFTDWFIFQNDFPSAITNSDWSGFLGGLWGGIIGGIGTLISIYISTVDSKNNQEWEKRQHKLERIVITASSYWQKSKEIELLLAKKSQLSAEISMIKADILGIEDSLRNNPHLATSRKTGLESDLKARKASKMEKDSRMYNLGSTITSVIEKTYYDKMILLILLEGITDNKKILNSLRTLNNTIESMANETINIDQKILNEKIEEFFVQTKEFLNCFEKQE